VTARDPHLLALQAAVDHLQRELASFDRKLRSLAAAIAERDVIAQALEALAPVARRLDEVLGPPERVH
jgi:hypothetical protein